jgi:hypothetical protein
MTPLVLAAALAAALLVVEYAGTGVAWLLRLFRGVS